MGRFLVSSQAMENQEQIISSLTELGSVAKACLKELRPHNEKATVIGLSGDLGSGKTAFTKALGKTLSISEEIPSPTFVIAKYYTIPKDQRWKKMIHIDLYRIDDPEELSALRWEELIGDPAALVVVEWPEKIGTSFPVDAHMIQFTFIDEATRKIRVVR